MTKLRTGRSILSQSFWLLVAGMIVVQLVLTVSIFLLPPPREEGVPLGEIAERLAGPLAAESRWRMRNGDMPVSMLAGPPVQTEGLAVSPPLTHALADRLGLATKNVRLYFRVDQGSRLWRSRNRGSDGIVRWRGEPFFFDRTIAAARIDGQWRSIRVPDRPFIAQWQIRMAVAFGFALISLVPLAWLFARRMARPIRAFADAADLVGRDSSAPMIPEDGSAELRVAARALNAMQSRIAEQMSERQAMVAAIAHDLRTPLSRIAFRIEGADDKLREPIQRDIDQMKAMISATLDFVRGNLRQGSRDPVDLRGLLATLVEDEVQVGRPVCWLHAPVQDCAVTGDRLALRRMIQNLLDNALKYGGSAQVDLQVEDGVARILIADHGPGLEAADIEAMFAPFVRRDPSRNRETGGAGLGLAIARAIARDHGGDIILSAREGGGLEATISLPVPAAHP
ncbi:MAG TPA: ATP-binding protein [Sphingobium sp.]|nr:ATP-binding protein [Sphingobium sp.]